MKTTNHPNTRDQRRLAIVEQLRHRRGFFPTDRQLQLHKALLGTPSPDLIGGQPQGRTTVPAPLLRARTCTSTTADYSVNLT